MERLLMGVATISDPDMLDRCLAHLVVQDGLDVGEIEVVCNSGRVLEACRRWRDRGASVLFPGTNLGTCRSWNHFFRRAAERGRPGVFVIGDDVLLTKTDTYAEMCHAVWAEPRALWEVKGLGFSGFALPLRVVEEVGDFDEGIYPAYFEDNDYHRRVNLLGIPTRAIHPPFEHDGSQSLRRWHEWEWWNAAWAFVTNAAWYTDKWGGPPGRERFTEPWGGSPERAWSVKERLQANAQAWATRPGWDYAP